MKWYTAKGQAIFSPSKFGNRDMADKVINFVVYGTSLADCRENAKAATGCDVVEVHELFECPAYETKMRNKL